jgi:hypothetical protein
MTDLKQLDARTLATQYHPGNSRQEIVAILARGFLRYKLRSHKKLASPLAFLGEKSDVCMDNEATIETSPTGENNRCRY